MEDDNDESSSAAAADAVVVVVVSTVLGDFFDKHPADVLLPTTKILLALLTNASTKKEEKYRRVRLVNPKIQQRIVHVEDALDVLALAGFVHDPKEECLVYKPSPLTNGSHDLANAICHQLESKIQELERLQVTTKIDSFSSNNDNESNNDGPFFLSAEERQERQAKARAARKAREEQRAAVQRQWEEDKLERKRQAATAAKRKASASLVKNDEDDTPPPGVTLRTLAVDRRRGQPKEEQEERQTEATAVEVGTDASIKKCDAAEAMTDDATIADKDTTTHVLDTTTKTDRMETVCSNDERQKKHPIVMPPANPVADELWKTHTCDLSCCESATGIRDTSYFKAKSHPSDAQPITCLKRLYRELKELATSLPKERLSSIWIRFDEETPQYLRALLSAPLGTPYACGLFCFDIYIPNDYPNGPPSVILLTTGGGKVRFGPNLYADGKVCLSLLGTWSGPKWSPSHSNLYQVLVSIQGLILGTEQPWFLEPGHGGWEGHVKGGDYVKQGQTLSGRVVRSEMGLPPQVQQYNNVLRAGTVQYAMLEPLQSLSSSSLSSQQQQQQQQHLQMFARPIHIHFFCNRHEILKEARLWLAGMEDMETESLHHHYGRMGKSSPNASLKQAMPKLEMILSSLGVPSEEKSISEGVPSEDCKLPAAAAPAAAAKPVSVQNDPMQVEETMDVADPPAAPTNSDAEPTSSSKTEALRSRMQEAANLGNFILAGQLQEQLNQLEDLERRMKEAAMEGNFIRAGRLQEQMEALLNANDEISGANETDEWSYDNAAQESDNSDSDMDDMMDSGLPLGGNVFAPPGHPSHYDGGGKHDWGSGTALNSTAQTVPAVAAPRKEGPVAPNNLVIKKGHVPASVCRLRVRLSGSKTCLEDFDTKDPLSSVYSRLESIMLLDDQPSVGSLISSGGHNVAPPLRTDGAFAQPQSLPGFTLLLSHPKQEFSLEMHGTKTLSELGLTPSATLTVLKCSDRGLVYRGELESRLTAAQGNAMDVDGLTYEGLMELTERVGAAKPKAITREILDRNSTLLSPSSLDDKDERHCPVCLGEFDVTDTSKSLRRMNPCSHIFHESCFVTWLSTKSSCPICKSPIDRGEEMQQP